MKQVPCPREALFLEIADDGLPILLNLHDPVPGPLLISADQSAGKTSFLNISHTLLSNYKIQLMSNLG